MADTAWPQCKEHPKYKAALKPRRTTKYPDGCPACWLLWRERAKWFRLATGRTSV